MESATHVGRYVLERRLAIGGMAEVFLASVAGPEGFKKRVVVKRMLPTHADRSELVGMFLDEARLAARFNHPNLVSVFELAKIQGQYCLAMEYIEGADLDEIICTCVEKARAIDPAIAALIVAEAAEGLHYAHELTTDSGAPLHVVHRDVSPANIIATWHGSIKVVDFGVAQHEAQEVKTESGVIKGKYSYMSPEQVRGDPVDRRSDIFSLGVTLYEMLTQRHCFLRENPFDTFQAILDTRYAPAGQVRPGLPDPLIAILNRMLHPDPKARFASGDQLARDLRRYLALAAMPTASDLKTLLSELFGHQGRAVTRSFGAVAGSDPEIPVTQELAAPGVPVSEAAYQRLLAATAGSEEKTIEMAHPDHDPLTPPDSERTTKIPRSDPTGEVDRRLWVESPGHGERPPAAVAAGDPDTPQKTSIVPRKPPNTGSDSTATETLALPTPEGRRPRPRAEMMAGWVIAAGLVAAIVVFATSREPNEIVDRRSTTEGAGPNSIATPAPGPPTPPASPPQVVPAPRPPAQPAPAAAPESPAPRATTNPPAPTPLPPAEPRPLAPHERPAARPSSGTRSALPAPDPSRRALPARPSPESPRLPKPVPVIPRGRLSVSGQPQVDVHVDGRKVGSTPYSQPLAPGPHRVQCKNRRLGLNRSQNLRVPPGKTARVDCVFRRGQVKIVSKPWADVYLRGRKVDQTPCIIEIYEGKHQIDLVNPERGLRRKITVTVEPGQTTKISENL